MTIVSHEQAQEKVQYENLLPKMFTNEGLKKIFHSRLNETSGEAVISGLDRRLAPAV
jgi:hypothetical protein